MKQKKKEVKMNHDEHRDIMDNKAKKKICPRCGDTVLTDVTGVKYCGSWRCNGKQI